MDVLQASFLGNSLVRWLSALGVLFATYVFLLLLRRGLRGSLGRLIGRIPGKVDDVVVDTLASTHVWYFWALALYAGSAALNLSPAHRTPIHLVIMSLTFVQCGLWTRQAVRRSIDAWSVTQVERRAPSTVGAAIMFVANLTIWSLVLLLVLQNLGIKVGALVAGLGVGGVAAALALQAVLGDLFASLSIYIDRPFDLGDFIIVGDYLGTVQRVGLRTTRLTSLGGEHIVLPNADLTSSRIRNYRRMEERRIVTTVSVTYGTSHDLVRRLPKLIEHVIKGVDGVRFDRAHFRGFGSSGLEFEYVYYVLTSDYNRFMDVQQNINLEIMRRFELANVQFALPTRTVHLSLPGAAGRTKTEHVSAIDP